MKEDVVLLALGANLFSSTGSPAAVLRAALVALGAEGLALRRVSRFWRTPAFPPGSGPDYVNAAAAVQSPMGAQDTLAAAHRVESALGRVRDGGRWGARVIDIDLLAMGDLVLPDGAEQDRWRALPPAQAQQLTPDRLILPHPRIQDRGFVLAPLAEIAPQWRHPRTGQTVAAMLAALGPAGVAGMAPLA